MLAQCAAFLLLMRRLTIPALWHSPAQTLCIPTLYLLHRASL
jgi:hypothetical protein